MTFRPVPLARFIRLLQKEASVAHPAILAGRPSPPAGSGLRAHLGKPSIQSFPRA